MRSALVAVLALLAAAAIGDSVAHQTSHIDMRPRDPGELHVPEQPGHLRAIATNEDANSLAVAGTSPLDTSHASTLTANTMTETNISKRSLPKRPVCPGNDSRPRGKGPSRPLFKRCLPFKDLLGLARWGRVPQNDNLLAAPGSEVSRVVADSRPTAVPGPVLT